MIFKLIGLKLYNKYNNNYYILSVVRSEHILRYNNNK